MRDITTTVYHFHELSDSAKETARNWYRGCMDCEDWDASAWRETIQEFAQHFGFTIRDYCLSDDHRAYIRCGFDGMDDTIRELSHVRLWRYLRNYGGRITVIDGGMRVDGHQFILEASNGACPFTGMYVDCPAFDELAAFLKRPDHRTFEELLRDCMDNVLSAVRMAIEWTYSDEQIDESIVANNYEFDIDGNPT